MQQSGYGYALIESSCKRLEISLQVFRTGRISHIGSNRDDKDLMKVQQVTKRGYKVVTRNL